MIQRAILATSVALFTAVPVLGADLFIHLGGTGEYDSNVFRTERNTKDAFLFTVRPGISISEDRGEDLNFSLGYSVPVEFATRFARELNDVDQIVDGQVEYRINDRLTLSVEDRFRYLRSTLRQERTNPAGAVSDPDLPIVSEERDRVTLNNGSMALSYLFAPRLVGRARLSSSFFDTSRDDRSRNYSVGGIVDSQYRLSQQHQVGGGARYGYQQFDERDDVASSQTHTVGVFASWRWFVDETTSVSVSAGPTLLISEQDRADRMLRLPIVPFERVSGFLPGNFRDTDNNALTGPVAAGSLAVPSFFANGGGSNCADEPPGSGQEVLPCPLNIVLQEDDPTGNGDDATIDGILDPSNDVFVTNIDRSGGSENRFTAFAEIVVTKVWMPTLSTAFRYSREQGNASGLGGSVVSDTVSLSNNWNFMERWQLAVRGDWVQRESVFRLRLTRVLASQINSGGIPGGGTFAAPLAGAGATAFNSGSRASIDTSRWSASARLTHTLFRNTRVFAQVRYDQQLSNSGTLGRRSDFENILGVIGFRHTFEPIKLW